MWEYTGRERPPFASPLKPGQESVWDYPRPPRIVADTRRVIVRDGRQIIADTRRAVRVLETASPPTFYLPPQDVDRTRLLAGPGGSQCEWKGVAVYLTVLRTDGSRLDAVGWSYPRPKSAFSSIAGWISFYPGRIRCEVAGERVRAQPGGFYGGWLTDEIVGPVKGEPGTGHW
jgi:uncharacterized protein (DUF427 family)